MSPTQLIAMRIERRALARLRKSCGMPLMEDDGRPGAVPGLVLLGIGGAVVALLVGYAVAGAF